MKPSRIRTSSFVLLLLLCAAPAALALPPPGAVNDAEALTLIQTFGKRLLVLDVRTPEEFAEGHMREAVLIPVQALQARVQELPEDRPVLILCRTGRRAATAYDILRKARPELVHTGLWYVDATPEYKADGSVTFR